MRLEDRLNAAWAEDAPPARDTLFRLHVLRAAAASRARRALWRKAALLAGAGLALISISPQLAAFGEPLAILALVTASVWALRQFLRAAG